MNFQSLRRRVANWSVRLDCWRFGSIDPRAALGLRGEQAAARMLRKKGYRILAHGEVDRRGEIDLIAVQWPPRRWLSRAPESAAGATIVFVEVKTQGTRLPGNPADRVDADKQRRLTEAALRYLKRHKLLEHRARFDVVAIWWPEQESPEPQHLVHYENAFEATGQGQFYS